MMLEKLVLPLEVAGNVFNTGLKAATAGVAALVGAMGVAVKATFDWAQELDSIQDIIGGTNEQAAAMNFTLRKSGVDTAKLTSGLTIMSKGLVKADGTLDTVGRDLKDFGINVLDVNGGVKDQNKLIAEISDKYNSLGTQQERVNLLTKTFGRSGAELIDFFDTLAAEGGIDAVTSKVERLGLVIDPGRYEQFTRSLEELKLVGLGLAVGFTEKVMPAFERFLEIVTGEGTLGSKAAELAANFDAFVGNAIGNMAVSVENWVAGGGPEELTNKLISWIDGIGDEKNQPRIITAAQKLITALGTAISAVDWEAIGIAIDTKLAETLDGIDWTGSGTSFGAGVEEFFTTGWDFGTAGASAKMPASIQSFLDGIDGFFQAAVGANQFGGWKAYFAAWGEQIKTGWNSMMDVWKASFTAKINDWGTSVIAAFTAQINRIIDLRNKIPFFPDMGHISAPSGAGQNVSGGGGRASGGPVIGGQTYDVAEFYRPERFTPATNGRVDPIDNSGGDITSIVTLIAQTLADEIGRSNRAAFEKVGR